MWSLSCSMCLPKMTARWVVGWFASFIPFSSFWHFGQVFVTSVQMTGRGKCCWVFFMLTEKFRDSDLCSMVASVSYIQSVKDDFNNSEIFCFLWSDKYVSITQIGQWRGLGNYWLFVLTMETSKGRGSNPLRTVAIHVLHQMLFMSGCYTSWIHITTDMAESMLFFLN
jgi:hypothetical protein